jgi:hypothetical protein
MRSHRPERAKEQPLESEESILTYDSVLDWIDEELSRTYDNIAKGNIRQQRFWQSLLFSVFGTATFYLMAKVIFGQMAMLFNIIVAIFFVQTMRGRAYKLSDEQKLPPQKESMIPPRTSKPTLKIDDFSNEFEYPSEGKPSRFRVRSRPFKPRPKVTSD